MTDETHRRNQQRSDNDDRFGEPDTVKQRVPGNRYILRQAGYGKLGFVHAETKDEGRPPYDPTPLLKLYLYGLLNRICSSGKLSIEATRNIEVMWLINGMRPSKRTLCYFKENNKEQLRKVFVEFNQFYKKIGLFGKQTVALDSVKVKANNSKKRNHNQKTIDRTLKRLRRE